MKTAIFEPIWLEFSLSGVMETAGVNIRAPLAIRATLMLEAGEKSVLISNDDLSAITSVKKDGVVETYTISGNVLTLNGDTDDLSILEIDRSAPVIFSVFAGHLVPGIKLSGGYLRGVVANIPYLTPHTYRFGLRAQWGDKIADCVKEWVAAPQSNQLTWNTNTLPIPISDRTKVIGRPFYTLGEFKRGQTIEITIDIYNPDFTEFDVLYRTVSEMVPGTKHFSALPLGISIRNSPFQIAGFFSAEAIGGDYFIEVYVDRADGPTPLILHFSLLGDEFDKFTAVNRLTWITDSDLGEIREGHPSHFVVVAQNTTGAAVSYLMAPGSRPLPIGMLLLPNGEIQGLVPHFDHDTVLEFSIKASSGVYTATQAFTFKVKNSFLKSAHLTVSLPLTGQVRRAWELYDTQIDDTRKYRNSDPQYTSNNPSLLLIRGLKSKTITGLTYDKPLDLIAGSFKLTKVMISGIHTYDVIYREFYDPKEHAGGFIDSAVDIVESPELYPENPNMVIRESTIKNLRSESALKVGLETTTARQRILGPNSAELIDPWMMSTTGQYMIAGVVGYFKPDQGQAVLNTLLYGNIPIGTVIHFDRLLVKNTAASYLYYLGLERTTTPTIVTILPPVDLTVDGVLGGTGGYHPEPIIAWSAAQSDATYTIRIYNNDTLINTITNITDVGFSYTTALQNADGSPGHIYILLSAVMDEIESEPLRAEITLRAGWGYAWGYLYGASAV